jgi:ATP-dependent helicase/nuclease subunit A
MATAEAATGRFDVPPETRRLQAQASDPGLSAWVSANAGAGKTTVLVRRVKRLLLQGVTPERILCLTYTTAAASNMANRLFADLAAWVTADDAALEAALADTLGRPPVAAERVRARRLFADALETPGGLKLQTIHAFCTRLLQSAPLEAGVPARFEIISDEDALAARLAALETVLRRAETAAGEASLVASLKRLTDDKDREQLSALVRHALDFAPFLIGADGRARAAGAMSLDLAAALDIDVKVTRSALAQAALDSVDRILTFADFAAHALAAGAPGQKAATAQQLARHREAIAAGDPEAALAVWAEALLVGDRSRLSGNLTRTNLYKEYPGGADRLDAVADALIDAFERCKRYDLHEASLALCAVAARVIEEYERRKRALGALDYGDLIARAAAVLESPEGAFLLYKLDGRIDHVLIDEAQDTSPQQWAIMRALTAEFAAGLGQRAAHLARTVFAVGDEKQSIYSFQGAAPHAFGEQRAFYREALEHGPNGFGNITLKVSFRSASAIMRGVDAVFARPEAFRGLSSEAGETGTVHESARPDLPGSIELWDLVEDAEEDPRDVWLRPIDAIGEESATAQLARTIAVTLAGWTRAGRDDLGRPFRPGDVLILLRKRNAVFREIVSALRRHGVPVAGVDRLKVAEHMAVRDMLALARAAVNPEDDLTVATVLKGPLIGLDEETLFTLAHGRAGSLRQILAERAATADALRQAEDMLARVEALARQAGPFAFFATILSVMGGRKATVSRFGAEAHDVLDALLERARTHEQQDSASLIDFVHAMGASPADVKRDLSAPGADVRVMTVHGAKGLEARIVILADLAPEPTDIRRDSPLFALPGPQVSVPVWSPRKTTDCASIAALRRERIDKAIEEHRRLLYVALTRAAERLILCGIAPKKDNAKALLHSWYGLAEAGLDAADGLEPAEPLPTGLPRRRYKASHGVAAGNVDAAAEVVSMPAPEPEPATRVATLPAWATTRAPDEALPEPPLAPASALAAAVTEALEGAAEAATSGARPGGAPGRDAAALLRGRLTHLLLQWLAPVAPDRRAGAGQRLLASRAPQMPDAERAALVDDALAVFAHPEAQPLFAAGSRAEVSLAGSIMTARGPRPLAGRIDRLAVLPDRVVIGDFKTTRRLPRDAGGIDRATLTQLALYARVTADLYPGRAIRSLVIYTAGPLVLSPREDDLAAALAAITQMG